MKEIFAFIAILILGLLAQIFIPIWWIIAPVCFLIGLAFIEETKDAVIIGFISVFILWGVFALLKSVQNDFILLNRMSELLPGNSKAVILFTTALIGGLIGLFSTTSGYFLKTFNAQKKRTFKR